MLYNLLIENNNILKTEEEFNDLDQEITKNMTYDDYRPTGSILISSFVTSDYTKEGNNQYKYL